MKNQPAGPPWGADKLRPETAIAGVLALTAIVFSRSIGNQFVLDDRPQIVDNHYLGDGSFIWRSLIDNSTWYIHPIPLRVAAYYRPLQNIWFALNFHLFGLHPSGWHVTSLAMHLVVAWMVYRVAGLLAGNLWVGVIASMFFAVIPINVEAAVWPSAVAYLLSAAFQLAAFEFYLRSRNEDPPNRRREKWLALSLGSFGWALLSFDAAAVFPGLVAAHAFIFADRNAGASKSIGSRFSITLSAAWPYLVEAAAYLAFRIWLFGFISNRPDVNNQLTHFQEILMIPSAIASYLILMVMPWGAGPAHSLAVVNGITKPALYFPLIALMAIGCAALAMLSRHPHRSLYLFCAGWFLIALSPVFNLTGLFTESLIHDRYLYFPSIGFCIAAADLIVVAAQRGTAVSKFVWSGAAVVAIGYALISAIYIQPVWHDDLAIYSRAAELVPQHSTWRYRLALALEARDDFNGARRELEAVHRVNPNDTAALHDLALVYETLGNRRAAEESLAQRMEKIAAPGPEDYPELALAADAAGDSATSETALIHAESVPGGAAAATVARAQILLVHGDHESAREKLGKLLVTQPNDVPALVTLAAAFAVEKQYDDALKMYRRAATLSPDTPSLQYKIALMLHQLGRESEAREECAAALAAAPDNPAALTLMAEIDRRISKQ